MACYQLHLRPVASVDLSPPRVSASCLSFLDVYSPPGPGDGADPDSDVLLGLWSLVWRVPLRCSDPSPDTESACTWEKQFGETRVKRLCLQLAELTTGSFSPCRTCKKERERTGKHVLRSRRFSHPLAFPMLTPFLLPPLPRLRNGGAAHQDQQLHDGVSVLPRAGPHQPQSEACLPLPPARKGQWWRWHVAVAGVGVVRTLHVGVEA